MSALSILYDSEHYCIAEFGAGVGIELVDKQARRSGFLEGPVAARLRSSVARLSAAETAEDEIDELLCTYEALLTYHLHLH